MGSERAPGQDRPPLGSTAGAGPSTAETHSSVVVLLGDLVYKLKKPLDLGFVDLRTRAAREEVCHREVELNRRLAPDVYLGVADLVGPDGQVCDHVVLMRRMPESARLSTLVTAGEPVGDHLRHVAHDIAAFHARAERPPEAAVVAGPDGVQDLWDANGTGLAQHAGGLLDPAQLDRVAARARRYIAGRRTLFEHRAASGRAVDGHGDLLAEDIFCLPDGPRILDCLEFDDHLRHGDVLLDVAFLAMDLERLGRPDLAGDFLAAYRELAADPWPASLADHYVAYRASVRAKVAAIRHRQGDTASGAAAQALLDLCEQHLDAARVRLILVGGPPGTGKSSLAQGLAGHLGATVLRSDEVRKELAGVAPGERTAAAFERGIYAPEATDATYQLLLERAATTLAGGTSVVLDASWGSEVRREQARALAGSAVADLAELRCECPPEMAASRIRRRAAAGTDPSDATPEVADAMAAAAAPWPEATPVATTGSRDASVEAALRAIG